MRRDAAGGDMALEMMVTLSSRRLRVAQLGAVLILAYLLAGEPYMMSTSSPACYQRAAAVTVLLDCTRTQCSHRAHMPP